MPLKRCPNCLGHKKIAVVKTAIRGDGTKVIVGHTSETCPICNGEGVVLARHTPTAPYMRHNFTDGSVADMPRAGDPWQVHTGCGGKPPQAGTGATLSCEALDFVTRQNVLRVEQGLAS